MNEGPPVPAKQLDGRRVLVVEDNAELRRWLVAALRREAARVAMAATAEAAVKLLVEMRFDIVVTDIGLPGMKGSALADVVRRLGGIIQDRHEIKIVGMTGGETSEAEQARFDRVLRKPFRVRRLVAVLRNLTERELPNGERR